ncbi:hypothetical protein CEXT_608771 [Caerostris extrusa]|uniref:Uncharacterized protein n=1 Tax=Caerostris extrusa TaxID=172846 RepID=A0AAV4TZB1_CAEEX|nr:hypothetical protein CEXT_608771 [Caerostris extrusa]
MGEGFVLYPSSPCYVPIRSFELIKMTETVANVALRCSKLVYQRLFVSLLLGRWLYLSLDEEIKILDSFCMGIKTYRKIIISERYVMICKNDKCDR